MGGDIYHCKGFMPWAGNSSTAGHWIDITHYFTRYFLTADRRGLDMAAQWLRSIGVMGFPAANIVPTDASGIQSYARLVEAEKYVKEHPGVKPDDLPQWIRDERAKPVNFNPREVLVPLGELTQYYESTWDPQALLYLANYAEYLNLPFKHTQSPSLADFGKHWHEWYYALTRDPRVIQRIREYMKEQSTPEGPTASASFAAFLYHATKDASYLQPAINQSIEIVSNIYENPEDKLNGYSICVGNPGAMILGRLPYLMHAADAAGLKFQATGGGATVPTRGGRVDGADKWLAPPRGWSNTGMTVLGFTPEPAPVAVRITGPGSYGSFRGYYQLFYGFPELNIFAKPGVTYQAYAKQQEQNLVRFPGVNLFKDPPTGRNFTSAYGDIVQPLPYIERADNDKARREYRLEVGGDHIDLPALIHADTKQALPQVAVISRTMHWSNKTTDIPFNAKGYTDLWFRPLDEKATIALHLKGEFNRYGQPTALRIYDSAGAAVIETSVLPHGLRQEDRVTLDPARHPLPWRIVIASAGDNRIAFTGADELFFAADKADFDKVIPKIPIYRQP